MSYCKHKHKYYFLSVLAIKPYVWFWVQASQALTKGSGKYHHFFGTVNFVRNRTSSGARLHRTHKGTHRSSQTSPLLIFVKMHFFDLTSQRLLEPQVVKRSTNTHTENSSFSWGKGWKLLTHIWQSLVAPCSTGKPSLWVLWWWGQYSSHQEQKTIKWSSPSHTSWVLMMTEGMSCLWEGVKATCWSVYAVKLQDLDMCKACVLPLETSLTPMRVAQATVHVVLNGRIWDAAPGLAAEQPAKAARKRQH